MSTYLGHLKYTRMLARDARTVKQVRCKDMAVAYLYNGDVLLYSYMTLVGVCMKDRWHLTTQKYSRTTSKQLASFAKGKEVTWVGKDDRVGEYYI